ncbi:MAG: hypothetical protein AAF479_17370, partial [Pseudomonadota bacterium]
MINGDITADQFALTSTAANTVGINLSNTTGTGSIVLGDTSNPGTDTPSMISGVETGIQFDANTDIVFTFGDGEDTSDQGSVINAVNPFGTNALPSTGFYNFLDVGTITGNTFNTNGAKVIFVDQNQVGTNDGLSVATATSVDTAESANADIIVLIDTNIDNQQDQIDQGTGDLQIGGGQILISVAQGESIDIGTLGFTPLPLANFQFTAGSGAADTVFVAPTGIDTRPPLLIADNTPLIVTSSAGIQGVHAEGRAVSGVSIVPTTNSTVFLRDVLLFGERNVVDVQPPAGVTLNLNASALNVQLTNSNTNQQNLVNLDGAAGTLILNEFGLDTTASFGTALNATDVIFDGDADQAGIQPLTIANFLYGFSGFPVVGSGIVITGGTGDLILDDAEIFTRTLPADLIFETNALKVAGGAGGLNLTLNGGTFQNQDNGAALFLQDVMLSGTIDSVVASGINDSPGIVLQRTSGTLGVTLLEVGTTAGASFGAGIEMLDNSLDLTIGSATVFRFREGIFFEGNTGAFEVTGTTRITDPLESGIEFSSTGTHTGTVTFADLDLQIDNDNTVGVDLGGATVNGAITATDFDLFTTSSTGTTAVDLRGATGTGTVRLGDTNTGGADAVIGGAGSNLSGPAIGIHFSNTTNLDFTFGDGEDGTDTASTISATTVFAGVLPTMGSYNFLDVGVGGFTGDTSLIPTGPEVFWVDQAGAGDGSSVANAGNIAGANAATANVIAL